MLNLLRKIASFTLIVALLVIPVAAKEVVLTEDSILRSPRVTYSELGCNTSINLRESLASYNISVKNNTLVEIMETADGTGTMLCATDTSDTLITKSVFLAVDETGSLESFTEEEVAAISTSLSGGNATVNPFNDSFQIVFMVSYYAYPLGFDSEGYVQPQTAMFIYKDPNHLYTISNITMRYDCYGIEGYFDGSTFTAITGPLDSYRYRIYKSQSNPNRNTNYSTHNPIASTKAIQLYYSPGGMQVVSFSITGVRNSTGASINITNEIPLNTHLT